eukprot:TRINITY_DN18841_c0_g1_i1.p1 TRINITY_DN18841_c0_g1~~TRINITY_DN18841_c0_g1_i1.p1  ORF type:complete len:558 (+),score=48.45 TRINITY_DN18841_c0_g1_i1:82-1755(+)
MPTSSSGNLTPHPPPSDDGSTGPPRPPRSKWRFGVPPPPGPDAARPPPHTCSCTPRAAAAAAAGRRGRWRVRAGDAAAPRAVLDELPIGALADVNAERRTRGRGPLSEVSPESETASAAFTPRSVTDVLSVHSQSGPSPAAHRTCGLVEDPSSVAPRLGLGPDPARYGHRGSPPPAEVPGLLLPGWLAQLAAEAGAEGGGSPQRHAAPIWHCRSRGAPAARSPLPPTDRPAPQSTAFERELAGDSSTGAEGGPEDPAASGDTGCGSSAPAAPAGSPKWLDLPSGASVDRSPQHRALTVASYPSCVYTVPMVHLSPSMTTLVRCSTGGTEPAAPPRPQPAEQRIMDPRELQEMARLRGMYQRLHPLTLTRPAVQLPDELRYTFTGNPGPAHERDLVQNGDNENAVAPAVSRARPPPPARSAPPPNPARSVIRSFSQWWVPPAQRGSGRKRHALPLPAGFLTEDLVAACDSESAAAAVDALRRLMKGALPQGGHHSGAAEGSAARRTPEEGEQGPPSVEQLKEHQRLAELELRRRGRIPSPSRAASRAQATRTQAAAES